MSSNSNSSCFTTTNLEPVPFPAIQQALFYLYTFTSALSVTGNLLVLLVYSCGNYQLTGSGCSLAPKSAQAGANHQHYLHHQQRKTPSLPSNRQYSIAKYLSNLAVSDIMLACTSTNFTYSNIVLGHW